MRARIGFALGSHWGGIAQALDVIALMSTVGAIGSLPALLNALTRYSRAAVKQLRSRHWRLVGHR
jgi:hypothetical protein